jgi:hypothetical protein
MEERAVDRVVAIHSRWRVVTLGLAEVHEERVGPCGGQPENAALGYLRLDARGGSEGCDDLAAAVSGVEREGYLGRKF